MTRQSDSFRQSYVNALANSPKEFSKAVAEYRREYRHFSQMVESIQAEADRATTVSGSVAGAGALAGAGVAALGPATAMDLIAEDSSALATKLAKQYEQQLSGIGKTTREAVERILNRYEWLEQLTLVAFDLVNNASLRLAASIELAREHGVAESDIMNSEEELDAFMLA